MHAKTVGDLDGDGFLDLIVAGTNGTIYWYEHPSWTRHTVILASETTSRWSTDIEAADVDGDGEQDLVVSDWYGNRYIGWFENLGSGGSWSFHEIGSPRAHDIEVGDLDLDGDLDLVTRQQGGDGNEIVFWRQESSGWTQGTVTAPTGEGLHLADLDLDGDLDVVIGGSWFENTGDIIAGSWTERAFASAADWSHAATFPFVGDINGDGRPDVVLTPSESAGNTYRTSWFEAPVDPKSQGWTRHDIETGIETVTHSLGVADIDTDGRLDVVTAEMHQSAGDDEVRVYLNQDDGRTWAKQVVATTGSHNLRVADIGNDGDVDLFGANWSDTSNVDLWENTLDPGPGGRALARLVVLLPDRRHARGEVLRAGDGRPDRRRLPGHRLGQVLLPQSGRRHQRRLDPGHLPGRRRRATDGRRGRRRRGRRDRDGHARASSSGSRPRTSRGPPGARPTWARWTWSTTGSARRGTRWLRSSRGADRRS